MAKNRRVVIPEPLDVPGGFPSLRTAAESAKILRVTQATVLRWCREGVIGHYRIERQIMISDDQLREYLEARIRRSPDGTGTTGEAA